MKIIKSIFLIFVGIIIGIIGFQTYYNIDNSIPDNFADKYKVCSECKYDKWLCNEDFEKGYAIGLKEYPEYKPFVSIDECKPYIKIEDSKVYCDSSPYLKTIKALNFRISDLKSCISKECINFSSMPSKCL